MTKPSPNLLIEIIPATLSEGPDYEKAAFGRLEISAAQQILTAAISIDTEGRHYVPGPYISGYHLAEWFVCNWWRLRWEPRPQEPPTPLEWDLSHRMSDIGAGYRWPNITISCNGFKCELVSEHTDPTDAESFQYLGTPTVIISANDFEKAVDRFVNAVLGSLRADGITDSNLQTLWHDLSTERNDPELSRFRRTEALLGCDPDENDAAAVHAAAQRLADAGGDQPDLEYIPRRRSEVSP